MRIDRRSSGCGVLASIAVPAKVERIFPAGPPAAITHYMLQPRCVILDEPPASLDFGNQGRVKRQIRVMADHGLGVLFTTHDPNQALRHADRVALLSDGSLTAVGSPSEILTKSTVEALFAAPVETVHEAGTVAFLPG